MRAAAGGQFSANRHLSGPAGKGYANDAAGIIQHRRQLAAARIKAGRSHANASRRWLPVSSYSSKEDTRWHEQIKTLILAYRREEE